MKYQITNISIWQNAKFLAVVYVPIGLIYSLIGIIFLMMDIEALKITAIIFILAPFWLSAMVVIFHSIVATMYNFLASQIGGIEFELTEIKE
jgi:hypothetical protein|tara:strand:- start:3107 stop:3382 length:276 start_codon:yes stop_codon:yes gene_type:complete